MEQPMSIVRLGVTDLKRSREFYERLGWPKSMAKAEGIVSFQTAGMALALCPRHELAKDANVAADGQGFVPILGKRQARLNKLRLGVEEDRSVAAMGHDPERRTGYGAIHFHCHLNWIEKVAVAVDDEC